MKLQGDNQTVAKARAQIKYLKQRIVREGKKARRNGYDKRTLSNLNKLNEEMAAVFIDNWSQ